MDPVPQQAAELYCCWKSRYLRALAVAILQSNSDFMVLLAKSANENCECSFKKQTFAMNYYTELRCSSFSSTVRCEFSNSMMWELLTNAERWFSDYSATEITLLFLTLSLLQDQIHPLPCLVLLIPSYSLLELIPCHYLSQLLESSLGLREV